MDGVDGLRAVDPLDVDAGYLGKKNHVDGLR
jgi:hypothetical protein